MDYYYHLTKNGQKLHILLKEEDKILGYIYLDKLDGNTWEVKTVGAIKGNGYKMYDSAMEFVYPNYITPSRDRLIKYEVFSMYSNYIDKRKDVEKQHLKGKDDWFNTKYRLDRKLGINFIESDVSIKYEGIKFFNSIYDFKNQD